MDTNAEGHIPKDSSQQSARRSFPVWIGGSFEEQEGLMTLKLEVCHENQQG
jgi:hypothetical protein